MPGNKAEDDSPQRFVGRVLSGRYRIDVHLGSGGFGDVFRAIQEKTGQLVAIKLLRPRYGRGAPSLDRQLARFRREMRVCAELHHAHIVRLIDSGETDGGVLFSVFEYVPGMTLAELLREKGALTVRNTIELMSQVLDALICAHGRGIIHRDLKPNNIMVSTTGSRPQTTVLDFGISAFREGMLMDDFKSLTVTREVLGTPSYAAPEQLRGDTASLKSDLYAWGLVFVECLTGRRIFDGASSIETAYRQLSADPVPLPGRLQRHWLGTLLRWVLEKDVSRRGGDGALLMERLLEKRPLGDLVDAQGYLIVGDEEQVDTQPSSHEPRTSNSVSQSGERRQITAVCCNVALGPTASQHPPEVVDQMLRDTMAECLEIATRYGGHPASNLGGQILIYFGFPRASDTDARRSGIVALEIAHELRRRTGETTKIPIEIRIGIHTGMVTTMGLDARSNSPVFGVTPTRAVHLAAEAPSNGIVVSEESFRYLAPSFELQPATSPRGERIYRMVAESRAESAALAAPSAPFVGRQRELDAVIEAWGRARKGAGTTVVLTGEAGIGKSRLARELRERLHGQGSGWIEARCLPESENSALRPIIDLLVQELDLGNPDAAGNARRLEAALVEQGFSPVEAMPLLCPWLGLPLLAPHVPLAFSPQKQKALLLDLLVRGILALAESRSAAILIEDLHWADPTTRELTNLLVERVTGRRVLLILTLRREAALKLPSAAELIELRSLERPEVEQIVDALTSGRHLPGKLVSDVVDRADGIPLFVEEIVRFLEDTNALGGGTSSSSSSSSSSSVGETEVPGKLRDLLTERLDRLGAARETAQIAATIGREFDYRLLAAVVPGDESALLADLEKMVSAELVVRRRHVDNPVYMFRHALIRDAAYESLLRKVQQQLHQKIAEALASKFPEIVEAQPELLASHYERAGLAPEAIDIWLRAGRRGLETAANRETIAHMRRALALVQAIPDETERLRRELDLQLTIAPALMAIEGWGSPRVGVACSRARDLCLLLDDQQRLFPALWGLWTFQFLGGKLGDAIGTARQILAMAEAVKVPMLQLIAFHTMGFTQLYRGEFEESRDFGARGLALHDPALERDIVRSSQLSSTVCCAYFRAASLWMLGQQDEAEEGLAFMHRFARELGHPPSIGCAFGFAVQYHLYQGDARRTGSTATELAPLSKDQGFELWQAIAVMYEAWARGKQGDPAGAIADFQRGLHDFKAIGNGLTLVASSTMQGELLLLAGRRDEALLALTEGMTEAATRDEHMFESELHRLRGEALGEENPAEAEASFRAAMRIAGAQKARSLTLRAATSLGRLLARSGRVQEARSIVQAEYGWFTQGLATPDLLAARALLDALAPAAEVPPFTG